MHRLALWLLCFALIRSAAGHPAGDGAQAPTSVQRRMSFHNRMLLNRAVLAGLPSMEVLLLARSEPGALGAVTAAVAKVGGRIVRTEDEIGYLRIDVRPDRLVPLVTEPAIEAYQISSFSLGTWYRDAPPLANATLQRSFEVSPIAATEPANTHPDLPVLTHEESRAPGFTADDDVGVGEWMRRHPTFDGRGVTIALVENGLPSFADPVFRTAKTLDGRDVPKIAGIVNAIDPAFDDETRVRLTTEIQTPRSWARVGNRTYILPKPGKYRFGLFDVPGGGNVIQRFAVVEEDGTGTVWIDADGDASFQNDQPLADVNERFEPRSLTITYPRKLDVSFVMGRGREPHVVHIYVGKSSHQSMTASVAAGNVTPESLASGVAPNARLLFVRISSPNLGGVGRIVEGFIDAAQHPDVDVISASTPVYMVPDTAADFVGLFFSRLHEVYKKPILNAAGNYGLMLGQVHAAGGALSAGSTLSAATFAAIYGGRPLDGMTVHPASAVGPSIDGAVKPDFLVPMERIFANLPWHDDQDAMPQNAPTRLVPSGYGISSGTSSSSPYAAGVVALLISAARQSQVAFSLDGLSRALRVTARPIPGFQAFQQGNGALDINAAWHELVDAFEPPRITAAATVVHPLALYAARGTEGEGILEFEGWRAGMKGTREIRLRRESGPDRPITYRLVWSADDGTFSTAPTVVLPLKAAVPLHVNVDVKTAGAHSSLLTLHDLATGAVAFRTQATIVASQPFERANGSLTVPGTVGLMRATATYFDVPAGTGALAFDLEVKRGVVMPTLLQSHGLPDGYYFHVHPLDFITMGRGRYQVRMPNPEPGTWTFGLKNTSTNLPRSYSHIGPKDDDDAEYTLTTRVFAASIQPVLLASGNGLSVDISNTGCPIGNPITEAWSGLLRTHRQPFRSDGLSSFIEIDVPDEAAALSLQLRSKNTASDLFLYDCTTGECFAYDIAFPAAKSQTLLVRKPTPGRWVAAVNAAPFPTGPGSYELDEVITTGLPVRRASASARNTGARWREIFDDLPKAAAADGRMPVVFFELIDQAAERAEKEQPWSRAKHFVQLRDRPVAIATAIYRR